MDKLIYTIMSGAEGAFHAQQVHANNLANADTPGFRADYAVAQAQAVDAYGYDSRHFSAAASDVVSLRSGSLRETGRDLDVAITGAGYLAVEFDGGEAYTRAGSIQVDSEGALTLNDRPVMGDGGPIIVPPYRALAVSSDGTISILPEDGDAMQEVDRLKLVDADAAMIKNTAGLLVSRNGMPLEASDTVRVQGRTLESSNVSAVEEMVAVMDLSRQFEIQMKVYQAAERMVEAGNRLVRE